MLTLHLSIPVSLSRDDSVARALKTDCNACEISIEGVNRTIGMHLVKNPTSELLGNRWWRIDIFSEEFITNENKRGITSSSAV